MSTKTLERPKATDGGTTPRMVHWVDPERPTHSRCGKRLVEYYGCVPGVDCVVCDEMKRAAGG